MVTHRHREICILDQSDACWGYTCDSTHMTWGYFFHAVAIAGALEMASDPYTNWEANGAYYG